MKSYLVLRLYGPMASWGLPAVGGDRPTAGQPTRSAMLGLLGAALGIKRENEKALSDLQQSVSVAIKQCVPSSILRDYHTSQVPSKNKSFVHRNRKSELGEQNLNTILSSRDYRCDGLWIAAISLTKTAKFTLADLQSALLKPVYSLSLGRKSCPLAAPLMPTVVEAETIKQALDTKFPPLTRSHKEDALWLGFSGVVTYFWEGERSELNDDRTLITHPWDEPLHRKRWQFKQRSMHQLSIEESIDVPI